MNTPKNFPPRWVFGKTDNLQHVAQIGPQAVYGRASCGAWHPHTGWRTSSPDTVLPPCPKCQTIMQQRTIKP